MQRGKNLKSLFNAHAIEDVTDKNSASRVFRVVSVVPILEFFAVARQNRSLGAIFQAHSYDSPHTCQISSKWAEPFPLQVSLLKENCK